MKKIRYKVIGISLLILFFIILNLITLCKFPSIWRDDVYMSDPAWSFAKNGIFTSNMGFEEVNTYYGRIYLSSLATVFKFFGFGPYQARIVSFFSGLFAGLFIYLIGKKLFDSQTGLIGAALFLLSKQFLISSHWARQEAMLTLFIVVAIYLYLLAKERGSLFLYFLCGLIACLSLDVHCNGIILPIIILVQFLFDYRINILRQKNFYVYLSGVILGIIYWIMLHILPHPSLFWQQYERLKGEFMPPMFSPNNLYNLLYMEAKRYINYILYIWRGETYFNITEMALVLISMIFINPRKEKNRVTLLIIIFTLMILFTLLVAHKSTFYLVYLYPFFMLSIASFPYLSKNKFKIIFGRAAILILISCYLLQNCYRLFEFRENNYYRYLENLKSFIEPGYAVAGQPTWLYGFYNTSNKYYALASFVGSGDQLSSTVEKKDIKYILFDGYWKNNSDESLRTFLKNNYILIATLKDKFYGAEDFWANLASFYTLDIYKVKDE